MSGLASPLMGGCAAVLQYLPFSPSPVNPRLARAMAKNGQKSKSKGYKKVMLVKMSSEQKMSKELQELRAEQKRLWSKITTLRTENTDLKMQAAKFESLVGSWKAFIHQVWS